MCREVLQLLRGVCGVLLVALVLQQDAAAEPGRLAALFREHSHPIALENGELVGPGADFLRRATSRAQFVALGEDHDIREIPPVAEALFRMLQREAGFEYLATEQDPLMLEWLSRDPLRGRAGSAREMARRYPYGFSFATDQELDMLSAIAVASRGHHDPLWGAEQAMGVSHYLDELLALEPGPAARALIEALLARSRPAESRREADSRRFISEDQGKRVDLLAIREALQPRTGSRAAFLIDALLLSDEIYGYYHRAERGEAVGLWNNWVREEWMKQRFVHHYRLAETLDRRPPKVLLKYGGWHITRGQNPGSVFTLGGLLHELAVFNGSEAYAVSLLPYPDRALLEGSTLLAPFAALVPERGWVLVDLRPFRPHAHAGALRDDIPQPSRARLYAYLFGFDAVIFMAGAQPGTYRALRAD